MYVPLDSAVGNADRDPVPIFTLLIVTEDSSVTPFNNCKLSDVAPSLIEGVFALKFAGATPSSIVNVKVVQADSFPAASVTVYVNTSLSVESAVCT